MVVVPSGPKLQSIIAKIQANYSEWQQDATSSIPTALQFPQLSNNQTKVIFYHVYLPNGKTQDVLRIVEEQVKQLGGIENDVTLLYNTIGSNNTLPSSQMQEWCRQFNLTACHHLRHYTSGFEEITLQTAHDFCQASPALRVGYLHNKGSHHSYPLNEFWRYIMTEAVLREECWNPLSDNNTEHQCNVCGLYFTADAGTYMAGNAWAADCSYVNQLIPALEFEARSRAVFQDALFREKLGQFKSTLFAALPLWTTGVGRYAAEWWIGSHPTIRPCDFSRSMRNGGPVSTDQFLNWMHAQKLDSRRDRQRATSLLAQFTPHAPHLPYQLLAKGMTDSAMKQEYHLLPGRIHRWIKFFGKLPDKDSWVWKHYPQGEFWMQAIQTHGLLVLDKVIPIDSRARADLANVPVWR